jgi:hypothetical protein
MDPGWFQTADELYEQIFRETVRKKGEKKEKNSHISLLALR